MSRQQDHLDQVLGALAGQSLPGGCDDCNAEQTIAQISPGVWTMTVAHDDDCPFLRTQVGKAGLN
ncbi:MAG: hypothetical protein WB565_03800 [Acidimicrobiales bacterium]